MFAHSWVQGLRQVGITLAIGMVVVTSSFGGPLHEAVKSGDIAQVKALLEGGAKVNERDDERYTPLHIAVMNGQVEIAKLLLEHKAKPNVVAGGFESLPTPLWYGPVVQRVGITGEFRTPLHYAALAGSLELLELLLAHKAKPNLTDRDGMTALHYVVAETPADKCRTLCEVLLSHGAKVNAIVYHEFAYKQGVIFDDDLVKGNWDTPLHLLVRRIIKLEEDNTLSNEAREAQVAQLVDVLKLLLQHGAKPRKKNKADETPLGLATDAGLEDIAALLSGSANR